MRDETVELYRGAALGALARYEIAKEQAAAGGAVSMRAGIVQAVAWLPPERADEATNEPPDTWGIQAKLERAPVADPTEPPDTWGLAVKLKRPRR